MNLDPAIRSRSKVTHSLTHSHTHSNKARRTSVSQVSQIISFSALCSLFAHCTALCTVCLFTVHCSLFTIRWLVRWFVVHCSFSVVRSTVRSIGDWSVGVRSVFVRCLLRARCCSFTHSRSVEFPSLSPRLPVSDTTPSTGTWAKARSSGGDWAAPLVGCLWLRTNPFSAP